MFAEYKNTLRKMRGTIIGWSISLFLYDWMMSSFYKSIGELADQMNTLLSSYPKELMAFFPIEEFGSPVGYIDTYFSSYMTIIIGIFAVGACAKLLVGDEENGILDLLIAHPISRTKFFWGRFLAFLSATVLILIVSWLGWLIPAESAGFELSAFDFLLIMFPLLGVLIFFGSVALFLSMVMPAARLASGLAGALLVGNFLLIGMSNLNEGLKPVFEKTPLYFYQGAKIINDPNWGWFFGLLGVSLVIVLLAWITFQKRDIRVGGEAGWQINLPFVKKSAN
ncbi:MAG: ABC transporter permease subunit [Aliifodinibius sp.]|nr:ABC transporter permease subunit [Fodinibius sp.]